ncbi:hypothetical protein L249_4413 [Ophiocordyceps polyrhachis-furcata BCC 54312]|uniref:LYC1 C-terminal domain-containing protein n=1 Tax=Ophiocordyceps polyrhachis-furcata BCC 54312 TaxID=1330021 RepID=A0A367L7N2_9HYPO|nr:hypothetical protein L249_4413 [Ophiocordyceps polyrhachis-furcata BCC 54312]
MATTTNPILVRPTDQEQVAIWAHGHAEWGAHLTPAQYEARERRLLATRLLRRGGLTPWMLTPSDGADGDRQRRALASCETLRKRALVRVGGGPVWLVRAEGVASVFVEPRLRGRGYAALMMRLLASRLGGEPDVAFSVLLRSKLASSPPPPSPPTTIRLALIPDLATLQWHFARQDFLAAHIDSLPRLPGEPVRGALYEDGDESRVWALWTVKSEPSRRQQAETNKLELLRLSYPESISQPQLQTAVEAVIGSAVSQSRRWLCTSIQVWNPDERLRPILDSMTHLQPELVDREDSSIASLLWLGGQDGCGGKGPGAEEEEVHVDWIANDKFGWC